MQTHEALICIMPYIRALDGKEGRRGKIKVSCGARTKKDLGSYIYSIARFALDLMRGENLPETSPTLSLISSFLLLVGGVGMGQLSPARNYDVGLGSKKQEGS